MGILSWVILGFVAARLEQRLLPRGPRSSFVGSMVLAFAGAMLGNLVAYSLGLGDFTGFTVRSILISTAGIIAILAVYRVVLAIADREKP